MSRTALLTFIVLILATVTAMAANNGGTVTVVHQFNGQDGGFPTAGLSADATGNLYGTTQTDGPSNAGTIFQLSPNGKGGWKFTVIYAFTGGADGGNPLGTLIFDAQGNGYGTASSGGANGDGVVYKLAPPANGVEWQETVLYSFQAGSDGLLPFGEVVFDALGNLYGTTSRGGVSHVGCLSGCGTVYELTRATNGPWLETVLHRFTDANGEGAEPRAGVVFDADGNLYGTTNSGGNNSVSACNNFSSDGCGSVFELSPTSGGQWGLTTLGDFNATDGGEPRAGVALDGKGHLYGVTTIGGEFGGGTLFSLTLEDGKWQAGKQFNFPHESEPSGNLVMDASGKLYGTTYQGGPNVSGSIFQFDPATWRLNTLYNFNRTGQGTGDDPLDGVFIHNGSLFLTTTNGGNLNTCSPNPGCGAVVELSPAKP